MNYLNVESVLKSFPTIKLPYEIHIDKKVSDINICVAIPAGNKCLAWFTNYQGNNVCFMIQINTNGNFESIYIAKTSFSDKLSDKEMGKLLGYPCYEDFNKCQNNS